MLTRIKLLKIDNSKPPVFINRWICLFFSVALVFLAAILSPHPFVDIQNRLISCPSTISNELMKFCQEDALTSSLSYNLEINDVSNFNNQFIHLYGLPSKDLSQNVSSLTLEMEISVIATDGENNLQQIVYFSRPVNKTFDYSLEENLDPQLFADIYDISASRYIIIIKIINTHQITQLGIDGLQLKIVSANNSYTKFLICYRYLLLLVSIYTFYKYRGELIKSSKGSLPQSRDEMYWLSLLLVLFNDPLHGIALIYKSAFLSFCSIIFSGIMISYLYYFWIINLARFLDEEEKRLRREKNNAQKFALILFFSVVTTSSLLLIRRYHDLLTFNTPLDNLLKMSKYCLITIHIYLVLTLLRKAYRNALTKHLSENHMNLVKLSPFFIGCYIFFVPQQQHYTPAADLYRPVLFYGLITIYVIFIMGLHVPSKKKAFELIHSKTEDEECQ